MVVVGGVARLVNVESSGKRAGADRGAADGRVAADGRGKKAGRRVGVGRRRVVVGKSAGVVGERTDVVVISLEFVGSMGVVGRIGLVLVLRTW